MAFHRIEQELEQQQRKWGEQNHSAVYWLGILMEEVGELAKAIIENDDEPYLHPEVYNEANQVAAVAVALQQSLDRARQRS